ncbi:MAG TPA: pantoate--beta-alanine ligase [Solirubrobacteraceae bacterium]|nr:pantoate--beta-alanine ligase [Solirubrobacteraceae bacterium]
MSETTMLRRAAPVGETMPTLRTIAELREALRVAAPPIGLVPTMGALHEGHLALLERARAECATVVMSLFVNPSQFGAGEDLAAYPREEERDARLAADAGVDVLFAPSSEEMYPEGFATRIHLSGLGDTLEGAARGPQHFDAVATVVVKLLNIVGPQIAYFGQKDAQQALVVKRVAADLDMPVSIEVCPTVRAADGLALSSRNAYLTAQERVRATALYRALRAGAEVVAGGSRDGAAARAAALAELALAGIEPDYLEVVDPATLVPVERVEVPVLIAVAARVGAARLIDNVVATPAGQEPR